MNQQFSTARDVLPVNICVFIIDYRFDNKPFALVHIAGISGTQINR